jgi:molybdenum cofactor cytidylyltransferase
VISLIVLAAGEGRRMGRTKPLVCVEGVPLLIRVLQALCHPPVDETIVVLGRRARQIRRHPALSSYRGLRIAVNRLYTRGMGSSIACGVKSADARSEAFIVALGDEPWIPRGIVRRLLSAHRSSGRGIVIPVRRGRRGHPVLFHRRYRERLLRLRGRHGGRYLIARHQDDVLEVAVASTGLGRDVDSMDSLGR